MNGLTEAPDPKRSTEFRSKLRSERVEHNRDFEWLKKLKEKLRDIQKQETFIIIAKELKRDIARMTNWKAEGPDHVQAFWFKEATILYPKLKQHL